MSHHMKIGMRGKLIRLSYYHAIQSIIKIIAFLMTHFLPVN